MKAKLSPEALKRLAALARSTDDDAPTVVGAMELPMEMFGDYLRQRAKIESDPNVRFDLERIATEVERMQPDAARYRMLRQFHVTAAWIDTEKIALGGSLEGLDENVDNAIRSGAYKAT